MEFSIAELLAYLSPEKFIAPKTLEQKLDCQNDSSLRHLQVALDGLEKIGVVEKERGKYRRITEDDVVEGRLRCSSKGFCFAIQDSEGTDDIYIRESQLNSAWNGDRVLVRVTKEGSRRRSPEGEVRVILERANPSVLARIKQTEEGEFRAAPLDDRLLFELDLPEAETALGESLEQLAHIEVMRYPLGQHAPKGRVVKVLGSDDDAGDLDIVCCKHDLPKDFPEHVLEAAKGLSTKITKTEIKRRLDLREIPTFTIKTDAEESADDAITLEEFEDGTWQLGIHIADVAHYVNATTPLDREAQKRGVSVYLGDMIIPMLPPEITDGVCSLEVGKDRLAVSVLITLDNDGNVEEFEVHPSVINVDYRLSYEQAEAILAGKKGKAVKPFAKIVPTIVKLNELSHALKEQRRARGAFSLNLPEKIYSRADGIETPEEADKYTFSKFHYDDEGALGAIVVADTAPIHSLLVELMALTNRIVAEHMMALSLPAVYRVHPTPDLKDVEDLIKLAGSMSIELPLETPEELHPRDYQNFTKQFSESDAERVLTYLLLATLKPAFYGMTPKQHFGLALEQGYVHFTAPVRRYPDLLIHRALHAMFESGREKKSARSKETVNLHHSSCHGNISWNVLPPEIQNELEEYFNMVVIHITDREKIALDAENDLEGLKKAELMKERTGEVFHGVITGVQSYGLFVEIEELLVEGLVHVSSLKDDWYEFRSRQQTLVGRKNRKQYRLGDRIEVQVKSVDYYRQQIDLVTVGSEAEDEESGEFDETAADMAEDQVAELDGEFEDEEDE